MRFNQFTDFKAKERVDCENGILGGVSVITEGEAVGHDVWIDSKTLRQVKSTAQTYAGGLKVKMNHYSGVDAIVGVLRDFRINGRQLRADLHLLKSCEQFDKILEMAETMPESFGLSIVFDNEPELLDKVNYARCKEIYSADLVDNPAANPSGLFSSQPQNKIMIQLDKTELCKTLGLDPAKATDAEIQTAYLARLKPVETVDLSKITQQIEDLGKKLPTVDLAALQTSVTQLQSSQIAAVNLAKKGEIDALISEASRDGKVVPLDQDDLYTEKDGVVTIKTEPAQLRKMLSKLQKATVQISRRGVTPVNKDGKTMTAEERVEFCRQKQEEGAAQLTQKFQQAFPHLAN